MMTLEEKALAKAGVEIYGIATVTNARYNSAFDQYNVVILRRGETRHSRCRIPNDKLDHWAANNGHNGDAIRLVAAMREGVCHA